MGVLKGYKQIKSGVFGVSVGLEYDPGITTEEMVLKLS